MNFSKFNFHPLVSSGVLAAGFNNPTPIQTQVIPHVVNGCDVMGLAQTGTGKTAAFVLPILHRLVKGKSGQIRALIIAPTRELAEQIHKDIELLGSKTCIRSVTIYGGVGINPQIQKLKKADIVIACPGRLLDHIQRQSIDLSKLEVLVLDEADQMLDMGFIPDIRRIIGHLPKKRQTLIFSATMPSTIQQLTKTILRNPVVAKVGATIPADTISHAFYPVDHHLKTAMLLNLLKNTDTKSVLVFTRTKYRAKSLGKKLMTAGYQSTCLQGNLSQSKRQASLDGFREGKYKILVATDIASRGIDIALVSHVINYDMPSTPESYIHRIGRTGRATQKGVAYTFLTNEDRKMACAINRTIGFNVEERTLPTFNYVESSSNEACAPCKTKPRRRGFGERNA